MVGGRTIGVASAAGEVPCSTEVLGWTALDCTGPHGACCLGLVYSGDGQLPSTDPRRGCQKLSTDVLYLSTITKQLNLRVYLLYCTGL